MTTTRLRRALAAGSLLAATAACAPTVKIEAPDKPIEINLNIKIEQEVRVKLDRDLDKAFQDDPALFGTAPPAQSTSRGKAQ